MTTLELVERGECVGDLAIIGRTELVFEIAEEFSESGKLQLMADGLVHERADAPRSNAFADLLYEVVLT